MRVFFILRIVETCWRIKYFLMKFTHLYSRRHEACMLRRYIAAGTHIQSFQYEILVFNTRIILFYIILCKDNITDNLIVGTLAFQWPA